MRVERKHFVATGAMAVIADRYVDQALKAREEGKQLPVAEEIAAELGVPVCSKMDKGDGLAFAMTIRVDGQHYISLAGEQIKYMQPRPDMKEISQADYINVVDMARKKAVTNKLH